MNRCELVRTRRSLCGRVATEVLVLAFLTLAAAQAVLTPTVTGQQVAFRSDTHLRYFADYQRYVLRIPEAKLAEDAATLPAGFAVIEGEDGVTLSLGVPFRVALSPNQMVLTVARGEVLGVEPHRVGDDARAPVVYYLQNAAPSDAAKLLTSLYTDLQVQVDARQRALFVMVNAADRSLVDNLVRELDAPRPQVMFEAEILEINQDVTLSLGIQYDSIFSFTLTEGAGGSILSPGPFGRSPISLNFGLNLLKVNGAANVLARPRITTLDGVEAQLDATQTFPVVVGGTSTQQGSVQNITTGITLRMVPRVNPRGYVEADLSIRVSSPTGTTSQGVPQFSSRQASTTVRVANGEPIAIGGLFEKRTIVGTSKVPILGDIPLLGLLFQSTRTEERNTDLVIVVTPRIIDQPGLLTLAAPGEPAQVAVGGGEGGAESHDPLRP